jgi:hypothetical protein
MEATVSARTGVFTRGVRWVARQDPERVAPLVFALVLAAAAVFLFHETRGTTFWIDEWDWALNRRANDLETFLRPHNEHLSIVPLAIYKVLFATAGLDNNVPFRFVLIASHLACVAVLFVYASRRVGGVLALLAATVMLFLGPAWQEFLHPFQISWLIPLATAIGALLMLDRRDRGGDLAACALIALALASSGLGLVIAIGIVVELLWRRRPLRDLWIVAVPLAPYAVWWLAYQEADFIRHHVVLIPGFAADAAAGAMSALTGLTGGPLGDTTITYGWGRPLAVAAVVVLVWRLVRLGHIPPRVAGLLAMVLAFWVFTALRRVQISSPVESRYLYVSALFVLLIAIELAQGVSLSRRAQTLIAVAAAAIVVGNFGELRDGGRFLRAQAESARAVAGAMELARPVLADDHMATNFPGFPFLQIRAGAYLAAVEEDGSPASEPAEIAAAIEDARLAADAELVAIHGVALRPSAPGPGAGTAPTVDAATGGIVIERGGCVTFRPDDVRAANIVPELQVTLPAGGLVLTTGDGAATTSVRRFAATFPRDPQQRLAARASATLRIRPDLATQPWHLRVVPGARVTACSRA